MNAVTYGPSLIIRHPSNVGYSGGGVSIPSPIIMQNSSSNSSSIYRPTSLLLIIAMSSSSDNIVNIVDQVVRRDDEECETICLVAALFQRRKVVGRPTKKVH